MKKSIDIFLTVFDDPIAIGQIVNLAITPLRGFSDHYSLISTNSPLSLALKCIVKLTQILALKLSAARNVLWDLLAAQVGPFRNSFHFDIEFKFKI